MAAVSAEDSQINRGWDVHSYTQDLRETIGLWREKHPNTSLLLDAPVPPDIVRTVYLFFVSRRRNLFLVMEKMRTRTKMVPGKGWFYGDHDLAGLNIWSLLAYAVRVADHEDSEDLDKLLVEMLVDTAQTCIQGDSHRIAMFVMGATQDTGSALGKMD